MADQPGTAASAQPAQPQLLTEKGGAEIGNRRTPVGRSDGCERGDSTGQAEPRDGKARIEAAHAVSDDVDPSGR